MYIQLYVIGCIEASGRGDPPGVADVRWDGIKCRLTFSSARCAVLCALCVFLNKVVLPLIPTISDASIKLTGKSISHVFQTQEHLAASLQMHYSSNFIFQVQV